MLIRATTTTIVEHAVSVETLAEFRQLFPNAKIQTIDGELVDSQCDKGHLYSSQGRSYDMGGVQWTKCEKCYDALQCKVCGWKRKYCVCHQRNRYDDDPPRRSMR